MEDKYAELEKRVKILEEMLKGFLQSEGNEIHIQLDHCQGDLIVGDNCHINLTNCPVGAMIPSNMEDSEALLDEMCADGHEGRVLVLVRAYDTYVRRPLFRAEAEVVPAASPCGEGDTLCARLRGVTQEQRLKDVHAKTLL